MSPQFALYRRSVLWLGAALLVGAFLGVRALREFRHSSAALPVPESPFIYSFNVAGILEESASPEESSSPYWWLDSGGRLIIEGDVGKTMFGSLPPLDRWRLAYAAGNSRDTDQGYRPQNLFRLVSRSLWSDVGVAARMRIVGNNLTDTPYRNESNGLLLMDRYVDGDTLYYAGIRVDGTAVIKKKYKGVYYTMAQKPIFNGSYDWASSPTLLPQDTWIDLRSETKTESDGSVDIVLFMRLPEIATSTPEGPWREILRARDSGTFGKTPPITSPSRVGIRTDFMDVEFAAIRVENL